MSQAACQWILLQTIDERNKQVCAAPAEEGSHYCSQRAKVMLNFIGSGAESDDLGVTRPRGTSCQVVRERPLGFVIAFPVRYFSVNYPCNSILAEELPTSIAKSPGSAFQSLLEMW
jgi:hypothetical protein